MKYKLLNTHYYPLTSCFLEAAFIMEGEDDPEEYLLTPNGIMGLCVIVKGETFHIHENKPIKLPKVFVRGLHSKKCKNLISPNYKMIGFRFKSEYLQLILRQPISDFRNQAISLADLFSKQEENWLLEKLLITKGENEIMKIINCFLKKNLLSESIESRINYCLQKIRRSEINSVESLSREIGISTTSLRALFHKHVGTTPKELIKISRLRNAFSSGAQSEETLTQFAYTLGYYDQAHFIHEFKEAIGISPLKYFSNENLTYDFYNFHRLRVNSFVV